MDISEAHKQGSIGSSLPSAEVSNETSDNKREGHESDRDTRVRVEILEGATVVAGSSDWFISVGVESSLLLDCPHTPEHSAKCNEHTESRVQDHVGLPLITHIPSSDNLEEAKDIPANEEYVAVTEVH